MTKSQQTTNKKCRITGLIRFLLLQLVVILPIAQATANHSVESSAPLVRLSFDQALQQMNQNNLSIINAENKLQAAEKQEGLYQSAFLPKVSGSLNGTQYNTEQSTGSKYSVSSQLTVTQNLFAGMNDWYKWDEARANSTASREALRSARSKAYVELKQVYQKVLYSKSSILLTQKIYQRRLDNSRLVELRFDSGRENKGNVYLFKAYTDQAKLDQLQAENALSSAFVELARTLGADQNTPFELSDTQLPLSALPNKPNFAEIAQHHPNYLTAVAQEEAARYEYKASWSGFMPSLDLSASYGYTDTKFYPQTNERWSAGLTLTIPFFNGGRDYSSLQANQALWRAQDASRADIEKQILFNLKTSYAAYQEALQKLKVDESFKQAAAVRVDIAKNKYNNGLLAFENWDQVENDFIAREKSLLNSQRDLVNAEANWLLAQGIDSKEGLKSFP